MPTPRSAFLVSLSLHGAGIAAAIGLSLAARAPSRAPAEIAVQPAQAALDAIDEAPPAETFTIEEPERATVAEDARFDPREWLLAEPAPEPQVVERTPPREFDHACLRPLLRPEPAPPVVPPLATVIEAIPGENPPPEYPAASLRRGLQGVVTLIVRVGADGAALGVDVVSSTGHASLDAAAVAAVRRWRFRGGPGETTVEVCFRLRGG